MSDYLLRNGMRATAKADVCIDTGQTVLIGGYLADQKTDLWVDAKWDKEGRKWLSTRELETTSAESKMFHGEHPLDIVGPWRKSLVNPGDAQRAIYALETLVVNFNKGFESWMEETGCRVNFSWKYGDDKSPKLLVIESVDTMVFKKPTPRWIQEFNKASEIAKNVPKRDPEQPA